MFSGSGVYKVFVESEYDVVLYVVIDCENYFDTCVVG